MIALSIQSNVLHAGSDSLRVTGISVPDWAEVDGVRLLRSVTDTELAVFNYHLLGDLLGEIETWLRFETNRGDPHNRLPNIEQIRHELVEADRRGFYAIFGPADGLVNKEVWR